jgi:hypothetical protein
MLSVVPLPDSAQAVDTKSGSSSPAGKQTGRYYEELTNDALAALVAIADSTRTVASAPLVKAEEAARAAANGNGHARDTNKGRELLVGPALEGASVREWLPGEFRDSDDSGGHAGDFPPWRVSGVLHVLRLQSAMVSSPSIACWCHGSSSVKAVK